MYNQYNFYGVNAITDGSTQYCTMFADLVLCFLCLSSETSKNADGIGAVLSDFCRGIVLVRKYGNTTTDPRNEGFTC